jgi:hypothetical protein
VSLGACPRESPLFDHRSLPTVAPDGAAPYSPRLIGACMSNLRPTGRLNPTAAVTQGELSFVAAASASGNRSGTRSRPAGTYTVTLTVTDGWARAKSAAGL